MLSSDTQNILARILLALAEGERKVEEARKEISDEDTYDIQAIFRVLDNNGDNYITPKDIQKYLNAQGLEVNLIEVKLIILFYDQDHDFTLTYGEIFKMIHPGKELPRIPKYKNDEEINVKVDRKLYKLLEQEILMARSVLALLEEIKHKRDFNIHSAFHALKYYACITGDSINIYLKNCGMRPTAGDIRAIVKRLDINKDEIIDFCEFHAFLGYPACTFCCPCFPCGKCGAQYCPDCLQDIPCYLLGCDHKGMDSKMKCTSLEHNPGLEGGSFIGSIRTSHFNPNSTQNRKFISRIEEDEEEKNNYNKKMKGLGDNRNIYDNNQFYPQGNNNMFNRSGYLGRSISPEQYKLLQGLTNPEQLNKFMTISGILDRQNSEEINLTKNLSLRLPALRDFAPKEWGCRNCPCNIHSNPNVSCDCCTCDICPFKSNKNLEGKKQKQKKFPIVSLYSYSYSYETDNTGPNKNFLTMSSFPNESTLVNSPKKNTIYFDREANKYKKTMASSDDEKEYNDYMAKVNNIRNAYDQFKSKTNKSFVNPPNSMIYNDEMSNPKQFNRINDAGEGEEYNNEIEEEENEEIISSQEKNIRRNKMLFQKMHKKEEENLENRNKQKMRSGQQRGGPRVENDDNDGNDNNVRNEEFNNIQPDQDENQNQPQNNNNINNNNLDNNINPVNSGLKDNLNPQAQSINNPLFYQTVPNKTNLINNPNQDPFGSTTKTIYRINGPNHSLINSINKKKFGSGIKEEESEEDLSNSNIHKSLEEIVDEQEKAFIIYIKALVKSEKEIEFAKRDLMRQGDFNGEDAFKLFEKENSGVVNKNDLKFGLKLLGIKPTNRMIELIFNKYDLNGNNFLEYADFFDMVISFKDEDRKEEERRKPNNRIGNRNPELFSPRTRELYKKLFLVIYEEEERLEKLKEKLNINEQFMNEIFEKINVNKDGICDKYEFANYCIRKKICKEKKDAHLVFIRLNRDRDGGLQTKELKNELKSSVM
jgi:Ca2+-binding EF-hand superfamily protein